MGSDNFTHVDFFEHVGDEQLSNTVGGTWLGEALGYVAGMALPSYQKAVRYNPDLRHPW